MHNHIEIVFVVLLVSSGVLSSMINQQMNWHSPHFVMTIQFWLEYMDKFDSKEGGNM